MDTSERNDRTVKVPHLVMALLFLGAVAVWALVASDAVGPDQVAFLVPGVLVAAGVLGLLASVLSGRGRRSRPAPTPPLHEPWRDSAYDDEPETDQHDRLIAELDEPDDLEHTAPVTPARSTQQAGPTGPTHPEENR